jgi:hypothetical protein
MELIYFERKETLTKKRWTYSEERVYEYCIPSGATKQEKENKVISLSCSKQCKGLCACKILTSKLHHHG